MTVAGPAVVQVAPAAVRGTHLVLKTAPVVPAGPCTPPARTRVARPAPADVLVSAPRGLALALALDLAHPGRVPVGLAA